MFCSVCFIRLFCKKMAKLLVFNLNFIHYCVFLHFFTMLRNALFVCVWHKKHIWKQFCGMVHICKKTCAYASRARGMLKLFGRFFAWAVRGVKCVLVIKAGKGNARFCIKGACVCAENKNRIVAM